MKRLIIVGIGSIGIRHARVCQRFEDLTVELCDTRADGLEEALRELGPLRHWTSFDEAVKSKPDMMIVATPHESHAPMSCAAMEVGIDVFCEKPASDTAEGARRMSECAKRTGRTLRIGFILRFLPAVLRMKEMIKAGELGSLLSIRYGVGSQEALENSRSRHQRATRGALLMDYTHGLDLLLWITGLKPSGVYARGFEAGDLPFRSDPNLISALVDFDRPLLAEIHMDYVTKPYVHEMQIVGDRATVRVNFVDSKVEVNNRTDNKREEFVLKIERDDLHYEQMKAFLAAIDGKETDACTAEEGLLSTELMEGIIRSLNQNQRLPLNGKS